MLHVLLATSSFQFYARTHNCTRHTSQHDKYRSLKRCLRSHETISRAVIKGFVGRMRPMGRMLCRPAVEYRKQCWGLPQIGPQIADSRFWLADLQTDFLLQTFAAKNWNLTQFRKATTSLRSFLCNFQKKKTFLRRNVSTEFGECIYKIQQPLAKFRGCETTTFYCCCYSYSTTS